MAQVSSMITNAFILAVIAAAFSAVASAQEYGMALAPSPDAGSGVSLPASGAVIGTSLIFSLLALLRH